MNTQNIIMDYEKILLMDEGINLSTSYFCFTDSNNHKLALSVFRYAVENILYWTPMETAVNLNLDVIKGLHLLVPYKYLIFSEELNKRKDCFYIAHLLYPNEIPYNMRNFVILSYQKILDQENGRFSKNYFNGMGGELRACICLQYLLTNLITFSSIEEIYYYFSAPKAISTLRQFRLAGVCSDLFESPLEFVHCALPTNQKNELYFQFYRFEATLKAKKLKSKVKHIIGDWKRYFYL